MAEALGLTPSGVSKALNNHPRISDKTKDDVRKMAKKLNYQPNRLATALRKGKSNLVGVIIPRNNSNFFSSVVENIEGVLNEKGYNVIISQSNESHKKECDCIDALLSAQVDGIIASMANETTNLKYYEKIKEKGTPLVLFDRGENDLNVDYICIDDYNSSHKVVEHLVNQGCKRIAHIAGSKHIRIYKEREIGYRDALKKHNLPIEDELIVESSLRLEDGRRIMQQLLELKDRPDAVYASGDYAALGALQVMQENNINVPEDIALIGFSNEPFTSFVSPAISTVNQHSEAMGKLAAETFLKRIDAPNKKVTLNKITLNTELIIRMSSNKTNC
ncbi:LacI family DNA-binding transcriptional regulator [Seonamhaeicola algicola]|uniref:LacI family DNA-binding transcriptional regulator n=1 Tax=Seonamhaeicola algicola TaxID=1719036 RepID=UPI002938F26A|nr:LacI family DNA-binding transcriptional regulator [Seonamhaeicola algicola]